MNITDVLKDIILKIERNEYTKEEKLVFEVLESLIYIAFLKYIRNDKEVEDIINPEPYDVRKVPHY